MRVLYLMTAPPPALPGTDAVVQEASALRAHFDGEILFLPPSRRPTSRIPRSLYGIHLRDQLTSALEHTDLVHLYHADLYPFPVLERLTKPTVYTVVSGVRPGTRLDNARLRRLAAIVVPTDNDRAGLESAGFERVECFPPGIDSKRLENSPLPKGKEFTLLAGSAPWTRRQFRSKGFESLLDLAEEDHDLRLILLWRGWHTERIATLVAERGLQSRVQIVTEHVDIGELLERANAAVVLADKQHLVKAYPHSLLEALACGRPVLVSREIPMSSLVSEAHVGTVAEGVSTRQVGAALGELRRGYATYADNARTFAERDYSIETLVTAYDALYRDLVARS